MWVFFIFMVAISIIMCYYNRNCLEIVMAYIRYVNNQPKPAIQADSICVY